MSAVLARAIQFALRPHISGNVIDRAQIANALYLLPPPEGASYNPLLDHAEQNTPEGYRLTGAARDRLERLSRAPDAAARRRLLHTFRNESIRTFEPDILILDETFEESRIYEEVERRKGVVTVAELQAFVSKVRRPLTSEDIIG